MERWNIDVCVMERWTLMGVCVCRYVMERWRLMGVGFVLWRDGLGYISCWYNGSILVSSHLISFEWCLVHKVPGPYGAWPIRYLAHKVSGPIRCLAHKVPGLIWCLAHKVPGP